MGLPRVIALPELGMVHAGQTRKGGGRVDSSLLPTKVRIPPPTPRLLRRERLIAALEHQAPRHKLTLIAAPAGYGKSTLLAQWATSSRCRVAWLSLDAADNDFARFFRYLLTAWAVVDPAVAGTPLGLLLGGLAPPPDAVPAAFLHAANDLSAPTVFVLDDAHLITDPAIHAALTFMLDHLPPHAHFVLAGRAQPPLPFPLARYRARQELYELGSGELRFQAEETAAFLAGIPALTLSEDEIAALHDQLDGWIAGLQLASLTLGRDHDPAAALAISGRHRFIADYLRDDVLAALPAETRRFLLRTSILDRLSGPLCDAVSAGAGGQAMLEELERENLFLIPLDDSREWFRYHPLFRDVLRDELQRRHPADVAAGHRRAARWFLAHDHPEPAFHHAVAGADIALVMQVLELYMAPKLFGGEITLVEQWLAALPAAWYVSHPMLGLAQSTYQVITGAADACLRTLDQVEARLALAESAAQPRQLARIATLRCAVACFQNDLPRAEHYADQALRGLGEEDLSYRADTFHALGDTYRRHRLWAESRANYQHALALSPDPAARLRSAHIYGALADLELEQGRLHDAARYWRQALAAVAERENWGRLPLPVIGWVDLRMAELLYEENRLAETREHLARGLERAELGGDVRSLIAGYLLAGRLALAAGDLAGAAASLERTRPLLEQAAFPDWASRRERFQLELWLAQDQLRSVAHWAEAMQAAAGDAPGEAAEHPPERDVTLQAVARALIVIGDGASRSRALALLEHVLRRARDEGRMAMQIEALALQALAHGQGGDRARALTALGHALRLAAPEGYVRLFVDLGLPMARLLQEARARAVMPDYVATLLAAYGADLTGVAGADALPEPLTARELDVLRGIASGLTNREIAALLFISPETVKKHTGSIYGKLGVANRTAAAARARDLDILAEPPPPTPA